MRTERWRRIDQLLQDAAALPVQDRHHWLEQACAEDPELFREVLALIDHLDDPLPFLEQSALSDDIQLSPEQLLADVGDDPLVGQTVGSYRIDRRIAAGGMGVVYQASRDDGDFDHRVAIKVMHTWIDPGDLLRRYRIERQSLARLNHPNIAHLLDAGVLPGGLPYLVMEYIDGQPIDDYCDERHLDISHRLRLFQTVCHAVHVAHQNLVIHRDLKPNNILVTSDGTPKLLDFGIATLIQEDDQPARTITRTEHRRLTVDYASPEQLAGAAVSTQTDVYSLGVILYELLTGMVPYQGTGINVDERLRSVHERPSHKPSTAVRRSTTTMAAGTHTDQQQQDIEELCQRRGTSRDRLERRLRGDLDNIVMVAMRNEPDRRYQSAQEFADDIQRHLDGLPVRARRDTIRYRTAKFIRRNRTGVSLAVLIVVLLLAGSATTWWQSRIAAGQRDAAQQAEHIAEQQAVEAREAERRAVAEAEHATIEAESAHEMAQLLSHAFLLSVEFGAPEYLARAEALLDRELQRVRRQYADQHHLRANLIEAIGEVFVDLHLYDRAQSLLAEAMDIREERFGAQSLEMARSYESIGRLHFAKGEYDEAARLFAEALRLHRELPGGVHTNVATAMNNHAVALRALGELDAAESLHREALALRRHEFGDNSPLVAESLNNLGFIAMERGEYDVAEELLLEALNIRRVSLGEEHPLVAQTLNNLAVVQRHAGNIDGAEATLRESLELYRSMPAGDPQDVARTLTNLAGFVRLRGELEEARQMLEESLDITRRLHGDDHPQIATALIHLAEVNAAEGNLDTAYDHWSDALRIRRATLPANHPQIALTLSGAGATLTQLDRAEEGETLLREAEEICRQSLPPGHQMTRRVLLNLAACLIEQSELDEAQSVLDEVSDLPLDDAEQQALQEHQQKLNERR